MDERSKNARKQSRHPRMTERGTVIVAAPSSVHAVRVPSEPPARAEYLHTLPICGHPVRDSDAPTPGDHSSLPQDLLPEAHRGCPGAVGAPSQPPPPRVPAVRAEGRSSPFRAQDPDHWEQNSNLSGMPP